MLLRRSLHATLAAIAFSVPAAAQSQLDTLFSSDNQGNPGGSVYFDLQVLAPSGISLRGVSVNSASPMGTAGTLELYVKSGSHLGAELDPTQWTLAGIASVVAEGVDRRTLGVFGNPVTLPAGTTGMAICHVGLSAAYSNGTGPNPSVYANPDASLTLGRATNGCFSGGVFANRVANLSLHYDGPELIAFGLPHRPIGNATLATDLAGSLVVSNLGSSGQDGISAMIPSPAAGATEFGWGTQPLLDWTVAGQIIEQKFFVRDPGASTDRLGLCCRIEGRGADALVTIDGGSSTAFSWRGLDGSQRTVATGTRSGEWSFTVQPSSDLPIGWQDLGINHLDGEWCLRWCWPTKIRWGSANQFSDFRYFKVAWGEILGSVPTRVDTTYTTTAASVTIGQQRLRVGDGAVTAVGAANHDTSSCGVIHRLGAMEGDGVYVSLESGSRSRIAVTDVTGLQPTSRFDLTLRGTRRDGTKATMGTLSWANIGIPGAWSLDAAFPGSSSIAIEVLSGGTIVASSSGPGGPIGAVDRSPSNIIIVWPVGVVEYEFDGPTAVTLFDGTSLIADGLRLSRSVTLGDFVRSGTDIEILATDVHRFQLDTLESTEVHRYGNGMEGAAGAPFATMTDLPAVGSTISIDGAALAPNSQVAMLLGTYRLQPIDLSILGITGGELLVDPIATLALSAGSDTMVAAPLALPTSAVGLELAVQLINVDASAGNPLGVVLSDAMFFGID